MANNSQPRQFNIREITDKDVWENFLLKVEDKTFLQSWNWGEFQRTLGEKIWRFGIFSGEKMICVTQVIRVAAKRGNFLLVPHGPVMKIFNFQFSIFKRKEDILEILMRKLMEVAREEKCSFIRIAPIWERDKENARIFKDLGFRAAPMHIHPELTWELDLQGTEEELLAKMRKTTRYLIRQGQKNPDLRIIKSRDVGDIKVFNELYQRTVIRHNFKPFSLEYLENEFLNFFRDGQALILLAKHREEYLAAAVVIFWQGIGFYHQGASRESKVPAAYLLQWEAIKEAKARGCLTYNFWGVADVDDEKELEGHPWRGLTLFKKGFGGNSRAYLKTQDLPVSWRYWLTFIFEAIRRKKRGF